MRKSVFVLALLTASFSGATMASDTGKSKLTGAAKPTSVAGKQMNDADMDKVTAGDHRREGLTTAIYHGGTATGQYYVPSCVGTNCIYPGFGTETAPGY
jgi:hypothetical protein